MLFLPFHLSVTAPPLFFDMDRLSCLAHLASLGFGLHLSFKQRPMLPASNQQSSQMPPCSAEATHFSTRRTPAADHPPANGCFHLWFTVNHILTSECFPEPNQFGANPVSDMGLLFHWSQYVKKGGQSLAAFCALYIFLKEKIPSDLPLLAIIAGRAAHHLPERA